VAGGSGPTRSDHPADARHPADAGQAAATAAAAGAPTLAAAGDPQADAGSPAATTAAAYDPIGTVQPVAGDANAQVASVVAAMRDGRHPERLSTMVQPAPFDRGQFLADPQAYLNVVEPGRAFQSATPGTDVPVLSAIGPEAHTVAQSGTVVLRVRTEPGLPATFTSFDLGQFGNSLASQTVVADAQGLAAVAFTPGPGTHEQVRIQAASPVASGQVQFQVGVTIAAPVPTTPVVPRG